MRHSNAFDGRYCQQGLVDRLGIAEFIADRSKSNWDLINLAGLGDSPGSVFSNRKLISACSLSSQPKPARPRNLPSITRYQFWNYASPLGSAPTHKPFY